MRLLKLLIGTILVFILVLIAGLFLIPGEKIAQMAAKELSRQTGREVTVAGDANMTLWPNLGVTVSALQIANASWSDNGPLFRAREVTIGVDARGLIDGNISIRALTADAPEILLERNSDGAVNWDLAPTKSASSTAAPSTAAPATPKTATSNPLNSLTLDAATITGATVHYLDRQDGTEISLRDIDIALKYPAAGGPADFDVTLRPAGDPVRINGTLAAPLVLADGGVSQVTANINAPGGKIAFNGRAGISPEAQGAISIDISDTSALARAFNQPDPGLKPGLGKAVKLSGDMTLTKAGQISLRGGTLASGQNAASLDADLFTAGARPKIIAKIAANALDLSALTGGDRDAKAAQTGWSTAPIDASALGLLDAEIGFSAPSIDLGITRTGAIAGNVVIDRARAVLNLSQAQIFDGLISGELVANNRSGLSVGGTIRADGIGLKPALSDLAGINRFTGATAAQLKFLGAGQTLAAIMNSLSGDGSITTGRGTIEGLDLDKLFRGGDPTGGTTIFDSSTASFTIANGVLTNKDLDMKLPILSAKGEGTIGLGPQNIDYLFTPISLTARDGRGLSVPVRIRGPWASPKITLDLEKALELNAAEEKKKLEAEAKAKLNAKLKDKLGVEVKEGQSTEDAVKESAKQEVAKKIGVQTQDGESAEDALKRKAEEEIKNKLNNLLKR